MFIWLHKDDWCHYLPYLTAYPLDWLSFTISAHTFFLVKETSDVATIIWLSAPTQLSYLTSEKCKQTLVTSDTDDLTIIAEG